MDPGCCAGPGGDVDRLPSPLQGAGGLTGVTEGRKGGKGAGLGI